MYNEINIYNLNKILNEDINLIDIRNNYSFSKGTIKDAKNIEAIYLVKNPEKYLDKTQYYYIFCEHGSISRDLCVMLTQRGYKVINIIGGYSKYLEDSI